MSALPKLYVTPEIYLERERQAETKSEYWRGEIFAMAGASPRHSLIATNAAASLVAQLKGRPCTVHSSDLRIKVGARGLYTYPDVAVICGKMEFDDEHEDTVLNPTVLIEVLSPSTEAYDRGAKFEFYRALASLRHYLLISQKRVFAEHYIRQPDDSWLLRSYRGLDKTAAIASLDCDLSLADVYDKVEWRDEEAVYGHLRVIKEPGPHYRAGVR